MLTAELAELGLLPPSRNLKSRAVPPTPRATYRVFLHALRHLRDPHVWSIAVPHFRSLLKAANKPLPINLRQVSDEMAVAKLQRERATKHIKAELNKVRAAVACHPHALTRLIEESYGLRGRVKWDLIKHITLSAPVPRDAWPKAVLDVKPDPETRYPPMQLQPLPSCLKPLMRKRIVEPPFPRARTILPPAAVRREALKEWEWEWANVAPPLILGPNTDGAMTGWENKGIVESLRHLAGLESAPRMPGPPRESALPTTYVTGAELASFKNLPPSLQAAFPKRKTSAYRPPPPFPPPRASLTRDQPGRWSHAREMTPRLVRRAYKTMWDSLGWVAQLPLRTNTAGVTVGGWKRSEWEMVSTGELRNGPVAWREGASKWTEATPEDLKWLNMYEVEGSWDKRGMAKYADENGRPKPADVSTKAVEVEGGVDVAEDGAKEARS